MFNATPFLKLYAAKRAIELRSMDPVRAQENQLHSLLSKAAKTEFGKEHGFGKLQSVEDFQHAVPLRSYEDFWSSYMKPRFPRLENIIWPGLISLYAVSSGTSSGATKYLPITNEMVSSNKKAGMDLLVYHLQNFKNSSIFGGKNFFLGGSTELLEECPGIFSGDLSGIVAKTLPWWAKPWYFPPANLALLSNWEEKMEAFARHCPLDELRLISGVPSWMLIFFEYLKKTYPNCGARIVDYFPNLEMLVHGGVNFAPYKSQFESLLEGSKASLREVYPASEGFLAIADRGPGEGMRMCLDTGIFYEFVPLEEIGSANPTRHWIRSIEKNVNYAVVMSTCAGLWGYIIGDTVRFVDLNPPRLLVTGRTSYMMSAFGEHLIAEEVESAVATAAKSISVSVSDYSLGALYPRNAGELGGHLFIIEFSTQQIPLEQLDLFTKRLEQELCINDDYRAHRAEGFGLKAPEIKVVPPGTFVAWMKNRGKLGGQHKVPRIINDTDLFMDLQEFSTRQDTPQNHQCK